MGSIYTVDLSQAAKVTNQDGSVSVQLGTGTGDMAPLPAGQPVTFTVTCNGGADTGSITFTTRQPPTGNSYMSQPPFNASRFGNYGWPKIDWNDQSKVYVDPMTGAVLKRLTSPGWFGESRYGQAFGSTTDPTSSVWSNPSNALSGSASTTASCSHASGASDDCPLFAALAPLTGLGGYGFNWTPNHTLDNIRVNLLGQAAAGTTIRGCIASGPATDSSKCLSPVMDFGTLPVLSPGAGNSFPASHWPDAADGVNPTAANFWGGWGGWSPTIDQLAGMGLMLWVKSSSPTGAVRLSLNHDYAYSSVFVAPAEGDVGYCSPNPVTVHYAADGVTALPADVQGQLCIGMAFDNVSGVLFLTVPATGETRLITPIYLTGGATVVRGAFDTTNPNVIYVQQGAYIMKGTYL
jgi:hypothetical protein